MQKNNPKNFFNKNEEKAIIQAIKNAELKTSGEIRVHLEKAASKNIMDAAIKKFNKLKMFNTKERNGCLIFIDLKNKRFSIIGDKGINEKVGQNFWDDVAEILKTNFKKELYVDGLVSAISKIGEKLKKFFPYTSDDENELSDEISKS
jgi:uncharacterized membrane protein